EAFAHAGREQAHGDGTALRQAAGQETAALVEDVEGLARGGFKGGERIAVHPGMTGEDGAFERAYEANGAGHGATLGCGKRGSPRFLRVAWDALPCSAPAAHSHMPAP